MPRAAALPYEPHFRRRDKPLAAVIRQVGPCTLRPNRDRFGMLVRSIVSQQISVAAARTIRQRLEALAGSDGITPAALVRLSHDELRTAGLSRQKAAFIGDLAIKCHAGEVRLSTLGRKSDEEVIAELVQVNGIGRWTAQMFLIFALGRPDVFPADDLGVKAAIQKLYGLPELPNRDQCAEIAARWSPFGSIGSWYCWRYLERVRSQAQATSGQPRHANARSRQGKLKA
jgi:DNA-3-methyladenine glycosylase II